MAVYGRSRGWTMPVAAAPSVQGPTWRGNEPGGMTFIADQPFTALPSNGWSGFSTWSIQSDSGPQSAPGAFEIFYPQNYASGSAPGSAECGLGFRTIYLCMYMKYSSNWQGEVTSMNKILYLLNNGVGRFILRSEGTGAGPLLAGLYLQGVAAGGNFDSGTTQVSTSSVPIPRGTWTMLEVIATSNTGSNLDGSASLYVNGAFAVGFSGIEFAAGAPVFDLIQVNPIWGGGGDLVSDPAGISIRYDHIYMSGKA